MKRNSKDEGAGCCSEVITAAKQA